jgi:hypothetical protein
LANTVKKDSVPK